MTIAIVHDSERGNGERLVNQIRDRLAGAGHTVRVGHERTLRAAEVFRDSPDLIIVGSAVRKFSLSPVTKAWIGELGAELRSSNAHPRAAVFVTHALTTEATNRKGERIRSRLVDVLGADRVAAGWISARVKGPDGPFHEGVEEAVFRQIDDVVAWASTT